MPAGDSEKKGECFEGVDTDSFIGKAGCNDWQPRMWRGVPCPRRGRRLKDGKKRHEIMG